MVLFGMIWVAVILGPKCRELWCPVAIFPVVTTLDERGLIGAKNMRKRWLPIRVLDILPVEFHYTGALVHTHTSPELTRGETATAIRVDLL